MAGKVMQLPSIQAQRTRAIRPCQAPAQSSCPSRHLHQCCATRTLLLMILKSQQVDSNEYSGATATEQTLFTLSMSASAMRREKAL